MNEKIPRTPFSTPLSGSAKETEMRLKNIFSGPKKRPPVLFLALMFALCIFCGNLVSCQVAQPKEGAPARLDDAKQGDVSLPEEREPAFVTYLRRDQDLSEEELKLLDTLFRTAEQEVSRQFQAPTAQLMNFIQKDGWVLGAVFVEDHLENTLILGIMDKETGEVPHGVFWCSYKNGVPTIVTFQREGEDYLLYDFKGQEMGQEAGEAGLIRFDGEFMEWQWPVVGDARYVTAPPDGPEGVFADYQEYWYHHLARITSTGPDAPEARVYVPNDDFVWGEDDEDQPKWRYSHSVYWGASEDASGKTAPAKQDPDEPRGTIGAKQWDGKVQSSRRPDKKDDD